MTQLHYASKYLIVNWETPTAINKPAFERYSEQVNPCSLLRSRVTAPQNVCGRPQQLIAVCESSVSVCKHTSLGKQCIHCVCVLVCLCCNVPPPGLLSTYWLKDLSCVFLTAESLLKTTGFRNLSVALRSLSALNSSALFCQTPGKSVFSLVKYCLLTQEDKDHQRLFLFLNLQFMASPNKVNKGTYFRSKLLQHTNHAINKANREVRKEMQS